ncbi:MAG: ribosome maturation factor RimP [Oscillatoriales cyanobacterium SM2_1_8]|nr:ribosome maturation factor RimP [Oscillatoriales cyanobacterium SM2_1_8]
MSHPLIEQLLQLATETAIPLGLEVVEVFYHTHKNPAVVRVDIRHPDRPTGLDDCEALSRALEARLDAEDRIPHAYTLEISSPGIDRRLESDRDFAAFRGFPVRVQGLGGSRPQQWRGTLLGRDETHILLNQKGRTLKLARTEVAHVELA